jgi:micrococcal nuclease
MAALHRHRHALALRLAPFLATAFLSASAPRIASPVPADMPPSPATPTPSLAGLRQAIPAEALRIIDGDTIEMRVAIWLDQHVVTRVRLRDIDAPEMTARCPEEARRAAAAAAALAQAVAGGRLFLTDIGRDKYGGRVLARLLTAGGVDIGRAMLDAGHARTYDGRKRMGWCG